MGDSTERIGDSKPGNQWQNLQLGIDLQARTISGTVGTPEALSSFADKPISHWTGTIDFADWNPPSSIIRSGAASAPGTSQVDDRKGSASSAAKSPAIEFDNLGIQDSPISPASTELL